MATAALSRGAEGGGGGGRKGAASFIAGAGAGVAGSVVLQPLDVVKTRVQAGKSRSASAAARELVQLGGLRSLWSGTAPAALRVAGGAGVFFFALEGAQAFKRIQTHKPHSSVIHSLSTVLEGAGARALAGAVMCPVTVAKTRIENNPRSGSLWRTMATIVQREGVLKLWSGLGATLVRDAPYSGLYLLCYRNLASHLSMYTNRAEGSPQITASAAALSGAAATAATQPADVLRARAQLGQNVQSLSIRKDGISALWLGAGPRIARRACQQAITWTTYEQLLHVCLRVFSR